MVRRIEEAFAAYPMPRPEEIADPTDDYPEAPGLRADFTDKSWRDVPFTTLMYWRDDMSWCFSPRVWVYYLQAWLIASLRTRNFDLLNATIRSLTPRADESSLTWFNERLALLGPPQREVIRDYIHLLWPIFYDELDSDKDPCPFWDGLITIPGGIAVMPPMDLKHHDRLE